CLGVAVIAVTGRAERGARTVGLILVASGGLAAATAKASFVPLLAVAVLVAALPVAAGVQWQQRHFAAVNAHNLVFTTVLPEVGPAALAPLGLPPAAL